MNPIVADEPTAECTEVAEQLGNGFSMETTLETLTVEVQHAWYLPLKRMTDVVLSLILAVVLAPAVLVAALLVKYTSRGPAFYCQTRLGRNEREFRMYKLRTMVHDAEAGTGPIWASQDVERVTTIGRILRPTQIDEFPQLLNVLLGHMSLIGPRPERPEIAHQLEWKVGSYSERVKVRPGITGLAQLRLPPDSDLHSVRQKLTMDLYYIEHLSPLLDLRILAFTVLYFLRSVGRLLRRRMSIPHVADVHDHMQRKKSPPK
ncbi:MAG: sugar transferase [Planctomycetaceae bacterium]|nr:sugar transferase [Planctomycetaceae bacterium]